MELGARRAALAAHRAGVGDVGAGEEVRDGGGGGGGAAALDVREAPPGILGDEVPRALVGVLLREADDATEERGGIVDPVEKEIMRMKRLGFGV